MNYRRSWWAVFPVIASLALVSALLLPSCGGGGGSSTPQGAPTQATVAIAFIGTAPSGPPPFPGFRNVLLNISAVRINANPSQSISGPGWVTIPVPSSASNGKGASGGDLQIDLTQLHTEATMFNLGGVPINTYQQLQVVIDPNNPGTIVPACQGGGAGQEGCTGYPITIANASQGITVALNNFKTSKNATAPLLIQLTASLSPPGFSNGVYNLEVDPTVADFSSFMGTISGTVTGAGGTRSLHLRPLTVSAELAGTGTVVESALVRGNTYTLELPAAPGAGTTYDLYVSGGSSAFNVAPGVTLQPGASIDHQDFTAKGVQLGKITGKIQDACTSLGIPGATVNLLAPTDPAVDCSTTPSQCVVVGTASTDQSGIYPLPGNIRNPNTFDEVPVGTNFGLQLGISATGYNSTIERVELPSPGKENCPNSFDSANCSFSLGTGTLNGTVSLGQAPVPGSSVQVQVFAEISGTNNLVSALAMPLLFQTGNTSAPFSINVPTTGPFDLFAVAIDPYLGAPDPFTGHTIATLAGVAAPGQCTASTVGSDLGPLECAGHGSITGTVNNPDANTTIQVEDQSTGVQILGTAPGLLSSVQGASNNQYALCIPPGNYTLQRFEGATGGATQNVAVPTPQATATPCPSTCFSDASGTVCPGQCVSTFASPF